MAARKKKSGKPRASARKQPSRARSRSAKPAKPAKAGKGAKSAASAESGIVYSDLRREAAIRRLLR